MSMFHSWASETTRDLPLDLLPEGVVRVFGVIDVTVSESGARPVFRARGPLARLGSGTDQPLFLVEGLGFVMRPSGRGELLVWNDASGVQVSPAADALTIVGRTPRGRELVIEAQIQADHVSVVHLDENKVWPDRVVTLIGSGKNAAGEWVFPDCPVRPEAWPYVLGSDGPTFSAEEVSWSIEMAGRPRPLAKRFPLGGSQEDRTWDQVGALPDDPRMLAIWPKTQLPGWRLYTIIVGNDADEKIWRTHHPKFWLGGSPVTARLPVDEAVIHRYNGVVTLHLDSSQSGFAPYFVSFCGTSSSGFFQLLPEIRGGLVDQASATPETVAIDLGTSTTVVAVADGQVLLAGTQELANPAIAVSNGTVLKTIDPWLPTVAATYMAVDGAAALSQEIPTGLFVRNPDALVHATGRPDTTALPFSDFTICAPGLDLVTGSADASESWYSNLKWGALEANTAPRTIAFLSTVLLWMAALRRSSSNQFEVRASYPLAFEPTYRENYGRILAKACEQASSWSGTTIWLAPSHQGIHPYCDESLALLYDVNKLMEIHKGTSGDGAGPIQVVFHADLGAETLDLMLAWLSGDAFRVIAAESIRFGADVLIDCLQRDTGTKKDIGDQVHRHQVRRAVRANFLPRVMSQKDGREDWDSEGDAFLRTNLAWKGGAQVKRQMVQGRMDLYAYLLAEYCARFLAGVLLDREGFLYRSKEGPGSGTPGEVRQAAEFLVLFRRSGNGWKFLSPVICGWTDDEWVESVKERTCKLFGEPAKIEFNESGFSKVLPKSITAQGTRNCESTVADHPVGPEASPNGWDDVDQNDSSSIAPWWVLVGSGSLVRNAHSGGTSSVHNFYGRYSLQQSPPSKPEFATGNGTAPALRTAKGQELWRQSWFDGLLKRLDQRRKWLLECRALQQARASEEGGTSARVKGTASAMWETLLRGILTGGDRTP
jgi:hypothetical protein